MGKKEITSFAGFVLVGAAGLFAGFAADLVKDRGLPKLYAVLIPVVLTLASFVMFWIQIQETARQEHARDERDRRRFKALRDMLRSKAQKKAKRQRRDLYTPDGSINYFSPLDVSFGIYSFLAEGRYDDSDALRFLSNLRIAGTGRIIEKALGKTFKESGVWPFGEQPWFELTRADDLQELADVLAVSEIESDEEPEREDRERRRY